MKFSSLIEHGTDSILFGWQRILNRLMDTNSYVSSPKREPDYLFSIARERVRAGDLATTTQLLDEVTTLAPSFAEAIEWRAEVLDMAGQSELSAAEYAKSRKVRHRARMGAPDRPFVFRQKGQLIGRIAAYTSVIHSMKRHVYPYIARGNAYLTEGKPEVALYDYMRALKIKPKLSEVLALKGEALLMMGRYEAALIAFDASMPPISSEGLSGRAIAQLALGKLEEADLNWRNQLILLPQYWASARVLVFGFVCQIIQWLCRS